MAPAEILRCRVDGVGPDDVQHQPELGFDAVDGVKERAPVRLERPEAAVEGEPLEVKEGEQLKLPAGEHPPGHDDDVGQEFFSRRRRAIAAHQHISVMVAMITARPLVASSESTPRRCADIRLRLALAKPSAQRLSERRPQNAAARPPRPDQALQAEPAAQRAIGARQRRQLPVRPAGRDRVLDRAHRLNRPRWTDRLEA